MTPAASGSAGRTCTPAALKASARLPTAVSVTTGETSSAFISLSRSSLFIDSQSLFNHEVHPTGKADQSPAQGTPCFPAKFIAEPQADHISETQTCGDIDAEHHGVAALILILFSHCGDRLCDILHKVRLPASPSGRLRGGAVS